MMSMLEPMARRLGTSPAKLGVMLGLVVVGLLLWGRLLLKEPPRVATATPPNKAATAPQDLPDAARPVVEVDLRPDLRRDLFDFVPDRYRPTPQSAASSNAAKSAVSTDDNSRDADAVTQAAGRLELQSVITGSEPHAMVNGEMVKVGDTIEGFTVVAVRQRSVVLTMNGITVRIGM